MQQFLKSCFVKVITVSLSLSGNQGLFAQNYHNDSLSASLIQKSKNQKTGAWILLGAGTAVFLGGVVVLTSESMWAVAETVFDGEGSTTSSGGILIVAGSLAMLGSIPLFIASGNNRQKALRLSVGTQQITLPVKGAWTYQYQPAVALKIRIGGR